MSQPNTNNYTMKWMGIASESQTPVSIAAVMVARNGRNFGLKLME